jgi:hypothetical protein
VDRKWPKREEIAQQFWPYCGLYAAFQVHGISVRDATFAWSRTDFTIGVLGFLSFQPSLYDDKWNVSSLLLTSDTNPA